MIKRPANIGGFSPLSRVPEGIGPFVTEGEGKATMMKKTNFERGSGENKGIFSKRILELSRVVIRWRTYEDGKPVKGSSGVHISNRCL